MKGEKDMRKKTFLPLGLVLMLLMQALLVTGASAPKRSEWTYMVYVCADNNLEDWWPEDVETFESVGSTRDVHFVALVDLYSTSGCELIHFEKGKSTVIETYSELNLGDPQVCIDFVNKVKDLYPAEKYLISFWNHGWGWQSFCTDESDDDWLDVPELGQIMDAVGFIDIVGWDACDMAQIDVYYELVGHASYAVGSEETMMWGWTTPLFVQDLHDNPTQDALTYTTEMVVLFGEFFTPLNKYAGETLSAVDVSQIPALTTAFTDWTSEMTANLEGYKKRYAKALRGATKMHQSEYYVDLYDYTLELLDETIPASLVTATENLKTAINNAVVAEWHGRRMRPVYGLTFYWATASCWTGHWSVREDYLQVSWGQVTGWADFLDAYYA
jgi:hypothetical protein